MFSLRSLAASLALAGVALADNIVTFKSLDGLQRTIYVTPNAGVEGVDPFVVPAGGSADVHLVDGFIGNAYAVIDGQANAPGMLAEFNFQGWNGVTFFDVSAIVNPNDLNNVKEMYPAGSPNSPVSGCSYFPCNNAYYLPDDIQTKSTDQTHLIVTLGGNGVSKRDNAEDSKTFARNLVERKY